MLGQFPRRGGGGERLCLSVIKIIVGDMYMLSSTQIVVKDNSPFISVGVALSNTLETFISSCQGLEWKSPHKYKC